LLQGLFFPGDEVFARAFAKLSHQRSNATLNSIEASEEWNEQLVLVIRRFWQKAAAMRKHKPLKIYM
jgi:hypothetical protein